MVRSIRTILAFLALCSSAFAFTFDDGLKTAASDGTLSDTQAAVDYITGKAEDGWDLAVGTAGGDYTWAGMLNLNVGRIVTIRGASSTNRPTIRSTVTSDCGIQISTGASNLTTFKDFRLVGSAAGNSLIRIYGSGECFHLTNLYVAELLGTLFWVSGSGTNGGGSGPFGLMDHCEIAGNGGVFLRQNQDAADAEWPNNHPITWGTRDAIFIEDCSYDGTTSSNPPANTATDGNQAAKLVFRYNTMLNTVVHWHGRDSDSTATHYLHGFLMGEVYNNSFTTAIVMTAPLVAIRSGTAVVHHNSYTKLPGSSVGLGVELQLHCSGAQYAAEGCRACGNGNVMTQALAYPADYPDCQMPGTPQPVRVWANTGANDMQYGYIGTDGVWHQLNREIYYSEDESAAPEGYTPFTYPHPLNTGSIPAAPTNNTPPLVSGVATQGQTLTTTNGTWSGFPLPSYARQWQRTDTLGANPTNISGATGTTYVLVTADVDRKIRAAVTASNSEGSTVAYSALTEFVAAPGQENRLTNPGFEIRAGALDNLNNDATWSGWVVSGYDPGYIMSTTSANGGVYAFKVQKNNGATVMAVEQTFVPANPGQTMQVSFWHKNDVSNYGVIFYVKDVTNGNANIIAPPFVGDSIGSYTKIETSFVVPVGCLSAKIGFDTSQMGSGGGTNMWLDDVVVAPPPPSAPRKLLKRI